MLALIISITSLIISIVNLYLIRRKRKWKAVDYISSITQDVDKITCEIRQKED